MCQVLATNNAQTFNASEKREANESRLELQASRKHKKQQ